MVRTRDSYDGVPFPPLTFIDTNDPITASQLQTVLDTRAGQASICVRSGAGDKKRGGYFFHFSVHQQEVSVHLFDGSEKVRLPLSQAVELVNHCTGAVFSEAILQLFQRNLNFREDS